MNCCRDTTNEGELEPRNKYSEKVEPEPVKFKILNFLGLKEYLIDRYVFVRSSPSTSLSTKNMK